MKASRGFGGVIVKLSASRVEHAQAEQVEAGAAIHLPFDQFQAVDVSFDRSIAPGQAQGREHGVGSRDRCLAKLARGVFIAASSHAGHASQSRPRTMRKNSRAKLSSGGDVGRAAVKFVKIGARGLRFGEQQPCNMAG